MRQNLIDIINYCLAQAHSVPSLVEVWKNQAFGALNLYCLTVYKDDPQAEAEIIKWWNEVVHPEFIEIQMGGIKNNVQ